MSKTPSQLDAEIAAHLERSGLPLPKAWRAKPALRAFQKNKSPLDVMRLYDAAQREQEKINAAKRTVSSMKRQARLRAAGKI